MQYDFKGGGLRGRAFDDEPESDPMSGLANLADVMLVLACGLMMALVVYWNLDLPTITELNESKMQQVDDVEEMVDNINSTTNPYMELGKVYQDPTTGKLYMMQETDGEGADGASDSAAAESSNANASSSASTGASSASSSANG